MVSMDTGGGSLEQGNNVSAGVTQQCPLAGNDEHWLKSLTAGESQIEHLAHRIEARRAERILITFAVHVDILRTCRGICKRNGYYASNKICLEDLKSLHAEAKVEADARSIVPIRLFLRRIGFRNKALLKLEVFEKALKVVEEVQEDDDEWFYFQDFSFYYTRVESTWPWLRSPISVAFTMIFFFYLSSVIFFCHIFDDEGVCPDDPTGQNRSYYGWLSALYFASTTMSTVGYGDLSVGKDDRWRLFVGVLYMIASLLVAILAFSAAADRAFAPLSGLIGESWQKLCRYMTAKFCTSGQLLYQQIRRVKFALIFEVILQFVLLNLVGVFVSRYFANHADIESQQWNWMTSLYWAVQTTTTIGYGDLDMSFELRWFQVFYLIVSTYFVGNALSKVASLQSQIQQIRRQYAWKRREVSKALIKELQSHEHDDSVDQYEFAIASLLTLGTISVSDLAPIMDKYRELAGESGYIQILEAVEKEAVDTPPSNEEERIDMEECVDIHKI